MVGRSGEDILCYFFSSAPLRADSSTALAHGCRVQEGGGSSIACCQCIFITLGPHYRHCYQPHFLPVKTLRLGEKVRAQVSDKLNWSLNQEGRKESELGMRGTKAEHA